MHAPVAEQPSLVVALHAMQALPPVPHVIADGVWQVVPEQHPEGHWHPLHAPPVHASPVGHASHAWPAVPHCCVDVPGSQVVPLQQPFVHDVASQTHCPDLQCWPIVHAAPEPHWQLPLESHPSLVVASHPEQRHRPPMHCSPGGQGEPVPQAEPRFA